MQIYKTFINRSASTDSDGNKGVSAQEKLQYA
jgi:hypothetical protein